MMLAALLLASIVQVQEIPEFYASTFIMCSDEPPSSMFGWPMCADEELHTALIDSLERGDRSVLPLLRLRWQTIDTYRERHRLAIVLIEHLEDDDEIWKELEAEASIVVDAEEPLEPDVRGISIDALWLVSEDPRSRDLLLRALASDDDELIGAAISGLAAQKHEAALPAIDEALSRAGRSAHAMARILEAFESEAANEIAAKYLR